MSEPKWMVTKKIGSWDVMVARSTALKSRIERKEKKKRERRKQKNKQFQPR